MRRHEIPAEITPAHRKRLAVVYVWQNEGVKGFGCFDLERERAQRQHAERWGWAAEMIAEEVDFEEGPSSLEDRKGYDNLLRQIAAGSVGLVLVYDLLQLGTCWGDVMAFLQFCQDTNTLVAVDGILVDGPNCVWGEILTMWGFLLQCEGEQKTAIAAPKQPVRGT